MEEFTYVTRRPPALARWVESIWYARGRIDYARERIAPTGSTVAVVVLGDPIRLVAGDGPAFVAGGGFLLGPHDRPVVNEPLGETHCVGVVTTPVGCRALFGVAPASVRGRVVDLPSAWPAAADLRRALRHGPAPEEALDSYQSVLAPGEPSLAVRRCAAAVAALESDPMRPIAGLAAELGVSHGHLDREFTAVVGLPPRVLSRILRLRALLAAVDVYGTVDWTGLAAGYGWFDQSHFIRDFRRHTGVTPSRYVAAQRAAYPPDLAEPGFIPEVDVKPEAGVDVKSVQDGGARVRARSRA
ncbi:helix-turn-helix domain-containing protein [Phytohabitans suffuscus]|uniref:AraC family transcriptional regulator n=1 Tax=Phytohabitans suffuscus TaxID=624315 RepID=A0A6F8YVX4_9ACTN|nr:helix-turn-helix domain-containing protein [Phytohabitans suffuscus]BCB90325.1 AraC family transcriptional regulator [Phytohabitans suffuscus]